MKGLLRLAITDTKCRLGLVCVCVVVLLHQRRVSSSLGILGLVRRPEQGRWKGGAAGSAGKEEVRVEDGLRVRSVGSCRAMLKSRNAAHREPLARSVGNRCRATRKERPAPRKATAVLLPLPAITL